MVAPPPPVDPSSGFCAETGTFHSLRPSVPLPPPSQPLSAAAYALSLLPSPLPSNPALVDAATAAAVSYPQLLSRVRNLQSGLGISKGHVAFILAPASLDVPLLYLALLSAGAVISPANPAATPADIARQFRLSSPALAFATSSTAAKLPRHVTPILLDSPHFQSLLHHHHHRPYPPPEEINQSDPAAILFSSGTTGEAKGAVLTHRNLIAELAPFAAYSAGVQMVTAPLFHVFGLVFCLKAVAVGETAVVLTERFHAGKILRALGRFRVTHLTLASPALPAIVKAFDEGDRGAPYNITSLEAVSFGAAPISLELIRRVAARFPMVRLSQGYGMTETTCGIFRCAGPDECRRLGSVGRLMSGCEAKIVDPETEIALPPCLQGELWVRGPTIMKGYIGDPEATSAILNSEGWLKTGDLCYVDNDGFLFVVDRLKELIKYKGYQVPPAELEHLLQTHPDVIEAAVIPYPDEDAGEVPMAFVVRQPHSRLSAVQVMEFVAGKVSPYKRIQRVSFVDSIPRNAAGKILKKDLVKSASSEVQSKL